MKKAYLLLAVIIGILTVSSVAQAYAGNCYSYASKKCVSNISYWYDSCGNIQAVNQNCNTSNQICSNGTCVGESTVNPPVQTYIQNYRTACYNNNIFWYDSNGITQNIQKSCSDSNSCTTDTCTSTACKNTLKCDGSTCGINSADYITYCTGNINTGTGVTTQSTITNGNQAVVTGSFAVSMFVKKESDPDWSKSVTTVNGEKLTFLIIFKNISSTPADNTTLQANVTNGITYAGNLKIDNTTSAGNIISGVNIGQLSAQTSKVVSFSGTVQSQNQQTIQASSNVYSGNMHDSDYVTVNVLASSNATASVSGSGFVNFVKKWYLWLIVIIVLIALFIIIFRRLSTNA